MSNSLKSRTSLGKFFHYSTITKKKRLSSLLEERSQFNLDDILKQILVGGVIFTCVNFQRKLMQELFLDKGLKNADDLYHLYGLFQRYVLAPPVETIIVEKKKTNKASN